MAKLIDIHKVRPDSDDYYVYALCKPCGTPFYIGKGKLDRINNHFLPYSLKINTPKSGKIKKYGSSVQRKILCYFPNEQSAYRLEELLIAFYGLESEGGCLVNYAKSRFEYSDEFIRKVGEIRGKKPTYKYSEETIERLYRNYFERFMSRKQSCEDAGIPYDTGVTYLNGSSNKTLYKKYILSGLVENKRIACRDSRTLNRENVTEIFNLRFCGKSQEEIAKIVGTSQATVSCVCRLEGCYADYFDLYEAIKTHRKK